MAERFDKLSRGALTGWVAGIALMSSLSAVWAEAPPNSIRPVAREGAPSVTAPPIALMREIPAALAPLPQSERLTATSGPRVEVPLSGLPPVAPMSGGEAARAASAALGATLPEAAPTPPPEAAPVNAATDAAPALRPATRAAIASDKAAAPDVADPLEQMARLRPMARPTGLRFSPELAAAAVPSSVIESRLRPLPRPAGFAATVRQTKRQVLPAKPEPEAQIIPVAAIRPAPGAGRVVSPKGSVCGIPGVKGQIVSPVIGRVQGCGIANPVRVTEVDGIKLSQPAMMDCGTAKAFHTWVNSGLKPAFGTSGGGITTIQIAGHYVCRTRNHRKGAKISEHGRGKAIDVAGLVLANGQKLSILRDWRGPYGAKLKAAHRAGCGPFGTTLGPGSDGMHEDHLHFDTAKHRNGNYCR